MQVQDQNTVRVHYKGTLNNGEVFDSSEGREPLEFTVGAGMVIPGFENGVMGMAVGDAKTLNIPCDEAYGQADDRLIQRVGMDQLPPDMDVFEGMMLASTLPNGQQIPVRVDAVAEDHIIVNANHPLAGKDLTFEITLVEIIG
ncbi:MAG: hypothetical protein RL226_1465 [Bacteroidota bacterium]|jgi:peptidylprolyl isomerase